MKRLLIMLAFCLLPVVAGAAECVTDSIGAGCAVINGKRHCNFYEEVGTETRECSPPAKYRDEDGKVHVVNENEIVPNPKRSDKGEVEDGEKKPNEEKQPKNEKPPEGGKQPKEQGCFEFEGHRGRSYEEVCKAAGWNYIPPRTYCNKDGTYANGQYLPPGNNAIVGIVYTSKCKDDLEKQPKQPEQKEPKKPNPNDGKQPKHDDGKQPKGEGQGDSSSEGNGKGSKGEGNGKGEGSGEGSGKGDAEGKGMFKGGAGSGQLGDVRVPKSRDGMGWKGDFFLRNPNQCPQDKTMYVLGRSITFSYAKLCSFLDMLSPVIKAVFMFIAGMLVVKSIRAK